MPPDRVNYKWALAMGTCHLPLQGLNHMLLQLLIATLAERSSGWRAEMRHSVFGEKLAEHVFSYFQELIYEPSSYISSYLEKH